MVVSVWLQFRDLTARWKHFCIYFTVSIILYSNFLFQCNLLGNNLKDVVDKYKKYEDSSTGLLKWLSISEEEARKQQSEVIAADPKTLQTQLEETKARQQAANLCGSGVGFCAQTCLSCCQTCFFNLFLLPKSTVMNSALILVCCYVLL